MTPTRTDRLEDLQFLLDEQSGLGVCGWDGGEEVAAVWEGGDAVAGAAAIEGCGEGVGQEVGEEYEELEGRHFEGRWW